MRAAIYARLSDVRKGDTEGIERQVREAEAHAQRLSVDVVERLVDNDISAAKKVRRPAFERLLEGIAAGEWDVVIFRSMDRWVRRPAELEQVIDLLEVSPPVRFETIHAGPVHLNTPEGRLQARNATNYSAYEVEQTRRRVTDWHTDRASRGLATHGNPGFGYRKVDGRMEIHKEEAELIRDAARRLLEGEALAQIAREWGRGPSMVKRTLLAPRTAGRRVFRGRDIGEADWEPILDRVTWERLRNALSDPSRRSQSSTTAYLLTGIASCWRCRRTLNSHPMRGVRRYQCRHCHAALIYAERLEDHVAADLFVAVDSPRLEQVTRQPDVDEEKVADEIQALEAELDRLADEFGKGEIPAGEWKRITAGYRERLEVLRSKLSRPVVKEWQGRGASLEAAWPTFDLAEKRRIVRAWVSDVIVGPAVKGSNRFDPRRVEIKYRA